MLGMDGVRGVDIGEGHKKTRYKELV